MINVAIVHFNNGMYPRLFWVIICAGLIQLEWIAALVLIAAGHNVYPHVNSSEKDRLPAK